MKHKRKYKVVKKAKANKAINAMCANSNDLLSSHHNASRIAEKLSANKEAIKIWYLAVLARHLEANTIVFNDSIQKEGNRRLCQKPIGSKYKEN